MSQSGGAQFTPGPWATFGPTKFQVYGGDPVRRIAVLDYTTGSETEEHISNANLIAAAPAMYEALKALLAMQIECEGLLLTIEKDYHCHQTRQAMAALAQAEGR